MKYFFKHKIKFKFREKCPNLQFDNKKDPKKYHLPSKIQPLKSDFKGIHRGEEILRDKTHLKKHICAQHTFENLSVMFGAYSHCNLRQKWYYSSAQNVFKDMLDFS